MSDRALDVHTEVAAAVGHRLKSLLSVVCGEAAAPLGDANFVADPMFPVVSQEFARMSCEQAQAACGSPLSVEELPPTPGDPSFAAALVTGPQMSLRLGCRVEPVAPHRITEIELVPPVGGGAAIAWSDLPTNPPAIHVEEVTAAVSAGLGAWLDDLRTQLNLVGVDAAVYRGAEVIWSAGVGWADINTQRTPDPRTDVVRVGSITKTMTTVRALQLVEAGHLNLDDRVCDVMTSWRLGGEHAADLRLHHLLSHTGGICEMPEHAYFMPAVGPEPEVGDWLEDPVRVERTPGEAWTYSNIGMTLLGQVVSDVTGRRFEDDIAEHVFEPLGMAHTSYHCPAGREADVMTPYGEGYDGAAAITAVHVGARAAGSVFSTMGDMGRWVGEVVAGARGGGRLLSHEGWRACLEPRTPVTDKGMQMARGFLRAEVDGVPMVWHNGGLPGATAEMWIAPEAGISLALFTNVFSETRPMALERRCSRMLADLVLRFELA